MKSIVTTISLLTFVVFHSLCYAADVLFVDISPKSSIVEQQLKLAAQFYGLNINRLHPQETDANSTILTFLEQNDVGAIVITAKALPYIEAEEVLPALHSYNKADLSVLITGVTPDVDPKHLRRWSAGTIIKAAKNSTVQSKDSFVVARSKNITRELTGHELRITNESGYHFILDDSKDYELVLEITHKYSDRVLPVFVKTNAQPEVFFNAQIHHSNLSNKSKWQYDRERFFEIAPLMMFLKYSCGERCWHSVGRYANLTIDDPWLTEPYGHLAYKALLAEMQKNNFHTTIAFIPWNFDRSHPEVVTLFREHPERLSVSIHGNNHDHREFYKYESGPGDPWPAKPLAVQEANIKQALARMEKFRQMTKIPYDPVMVFPHGIAPSRTLGLLKKYNFSATVNAVNIPLEAKEPPSGLFRLRQVTVDFESFASLKRYHPDRSRTDVAIDLFLGNPLLFYAHHELLANGIDSFNNIARNVNSIQPKIHWTSLGKLIQHLYLQRLRQDGNYDVLAFTSNLILKNDLTRRVTYLIRKEESLSRPIRRITVDSKEYPYEQEQTEVILTVSIPVRQSRHIVIEYENDLNVESIDVSKKDMRVNVLRRLSDLRDMTFSTSLVGQAFTYMYYQSGFFVLGLKGLGILGVVCSVVTVYGWSYLQRRIRRKSEIL